MMSLSKVRSRLLSRTAYQLLEAARPTNSFQSLCITGGKENAWENNVVFTRAFSTARSPHVVHQLPRKRQTQDEWNQVRQECLVFLQQVELNAGRYPVGMISVQCKNLMIRIVNARKSLQHGDSEVSSNLQTGPLAARLLEAALKDLEVSDHTNKELQRNEMRTKLYQLTIEAWLISCTNTRGLPGITREKAWNEAEQLLWEILDSVQMQTQNQTIHQKYEIKGNAFFSRNLEQNVKNINGAFSLLAFHFCKGDGKQQLSNRTKSRLEPILERIQLLWDDPSVLLVPSSSAIDAILYYHFKSKNAKAAHRILQSVIQNPHNINRFLKPSLHGMNTVISAHAKEGNVQEAREIIELMLAGKKDEKGTLPRPNVVSFNGLLDAISQQGGQDAGLRAEHVLQWMMQQHNNKLSIAPNTVSFATAISAWVKSRHPDAAERAEAILGHSLDLFVSGARDTAPNDVTFSTVINAWAQSGRPDAVQRAFTVLESMKKLYEEENLPTQRLTHVFNSLITTLARSKSCKSRDANDKLEDCLQYMDTLGVPRDSVTYNSIMNAIMAHNGRDGPEKVLKYFSELEENHKSGDTARLDQYSFNIALDALSKVCNNRETAPGQALELLQRMTERYNIEPTTSTINTVMKILARSSMENAALRCEHLLEMMEGPGSLKPSTISYSTCISAWGYSRSPERYSRMRQLLFRMEASYKAGNKEAQPNVVPFNTVFLGCCCGSSADHRETALECTLSTLDHLRHTPGVQTNEFTYPLVIRAIGLNTKIGKRRDDLLAKEFEACVKDGLVCVEVLKAIREESPHLLQSHYQSGDTSEAAAGNKSTDSFDLGHVPAEWKRNLPGTSRRSGSSIL